MRRQLLFVLVVFIAGCATAPRPTGVPANIDLEHLDRWQARGRLGVSGPENGGSGSFDWQQRGDRTQVQIRGPVGVGSVRLELHGDPSSPALTLETADGRKLESTAAWDELEARLGAPVPAGNLRYWMDRRKRASMRLLPVRPGDERHRLADDEQEPDGRGHRRGHVRQHLPLRHLRAHSFRDQARCQRAGMRTHHERSRK